ncbi:MAG: ethanolamine utilization protein EutH [Emergencia sp.]
MAINTVILWIMSCGILLGAADKITGNHMGLGEKFDEGFKSMGPLSLGMVGMVCLTPVISETITPLLYPVTVILGIDPAVFGCILANDMGGYALSVELALNSEMGLYMGNIVASMLGCTLVFSIPVGLSMIEKEDRIFYSKGLLIGITTIPVGSIIGGLVAGFDTKNMIFNTLPIITVSVLIAIGLYFIPDLMVKGCSTFGTMITAVIYIGLACASFEHLTGVTIIKGMIPINDAIDIVAEICIVLLGAFPVLYGITELMRRPMIWLGKKLNLDVLSLSGLIYSLANSVPVFPLMKNMTKRGIVINTAWLVPATAALGDHLGFTSAVQPDLLIPMIAGKLSAGVIALISSYIITADKESETKI